MTVNKLYEELKKAIDAGCGNISIRVGVPYLCIDDDNKIVEDDNKFDTEPINLTAEQIIHAKEHNAQGVVVDYMFNQEDNDD